MLGLLWKTLFKFFPIEYLSFSNVLFIIKSAIIVELKYLKYFHDLF